LLSTSEMREDGVVCRAWLNLGGSRRVELNLHLFFVLTVVSVTAVLAVGLFPRLFPDWRPALYWLVASSVALLDCLAALAHELGHAAAAMARGRRVYRITLYGLAAAARRSAGPARPRDQFAIALAGPVSHLLLAATLLCAWRLLPGDNEPLRVAMGFPAVTNFAAGLLNLVPVSPLDGGRVVRALLAALYRTRWSVS
jgi:Zn-dependent protease